MTVDATEIVTLRVAHPLQLRILQQIIVAPAFCRPPMFLDNSACVKSNVHSLVRMRSDFENFFEIEISRKRKLKMDQEEEEYFLFFSTEINTNTHVVILIFNSPGATRLGFGRSSR